jgi:hypothetical protein
MNGVLRGLVIALSQPATGARRLDPPQEPSEAWTAAVIETYRRLTGKIPTPEEVEHVRMDLASSPRFGNPLPR